MRTDPLVEEVRAAGQRYIDSFKGDLKAVVADLNRRSRAENRTVVSLPPKRVVTTPVKKAE